MGLEFLPVGPSILVHIPIGKYIDRISWLKLHQLVGKPGFLPVNANGLLIPL
jgi:hypothetical protein